MTFQEAQAQAAKRSEAITIAAEKKIAAGYRSAFKAIDSELKALYIKIQEAEIPEKEYFNYMTKFNRLDKLRAAILKEYTLAAKRAGSIQINTGLQTITDYYYRNQYLINWTQDANMVFTLLDPKVAEYSVTGSPEIWKAIRDRAKEQARLSKVFGSIQAYTPQAGTLTAILQENTRKTANAIERTLTSSLMQGKSYTKTSRDLRKVFKTTINNAIRIARTEGTRNLNAGAYAAANMARSNGANVVRVWDATLDTRTRGTHATADGQQEDANGNFHVGGASGPYPGNMDLASQSINCRCRANTQVKGFPPELRRARDPVTGQTDIISNQSFNEWAKNNNLEYTNKGWVVK